MGMYDSITCKYPLPQPADPKGYVPSQVFQTKCFDCALSTYEIGLNGQLYIHESEGHFEEKQDGDHFLNLGEYVVTKRWVEPLTNTCEITMYDYIHSSDTEFDYHIEYDISFYIGILREVKLVKFEAWPNVDRKKRDEEFKVNLKKRRDFIQTRRYKYVYRPYNIVTRTVLRGALKCLEKLNKLINKLERKIII